MLVKYFNMYSRSREVGRNTDLNFAVLIKTTTHEQSPGCRQLRGAAADVVPSGGAAADAALSDQVVCGQDTQKT